MKIDLHTHILPARWPDWTRRFGYDGFPYLDHHAPGRARVMIGSCVFREVSENCWDPRRRIEECDRAGVTTQVLSTVPVLFSYWARPADGAEIARFLNDHVASVVAEFPARFVGLGTLPMQDPERAVRELERCVTPAGRGGLGLCGVQIGTHVEPNEHTGRREVWNLSDPALFRVFQAAAELKAAVFVHPWDMMGKERMPRYWLPWLVGMPAETSLAICSMIFGGVLERLPALRVCFAHGGGAFPGTIGRIEHGFHVRPDLCAVDNAVAPRDYLAHADGHGRVRPARFYVDSLVHDADALRLLLKLFTPQRVALGSDYPFPLGEAHPGRLIESLPELTEDVRNQLLWQTAREFLGLEAGPAGAARAV